MIKFKHILLVFVCIFGFALNGLSSPPNTEGDKEGEDWPIQIPIDGGVSALIFAGVAYGVKKYRDYRKSKDEDNQQI